MISLGLAPKARENLAQGGAKRNPGYSINLTHRSEGAEERNAGPQSTSPQSKSPADRGRDKGELRPSLRTGLADFLHPALQLVVNFQEDRRAAAYACFKENKPTAEKKLFCHRY